MIALYLDAGNDKNGNPRRGWLLVSSDGTFYDFVDEGYSGHSALRQQYPNVVSTERIPTTPAFYREARQR